VGRLGGRFRLNLEEVSEISLKRSGVQRACAVGGKEGWPAIGRGCCGGETEAPMRSSTRGAGAMVRREAGAFEAHDRGAGDDDLGGLVPKERRATGGEERSGKGPRKKK